MARWWSEPRNHRDVHAVAPGDLRQRLFAGIPALDGLFALIFAQLSLAAELDPIREAASFPE